DTGGHIRDVRVRWREVRVVQEIENLRAELEARMAGGDAPDGREVHQLGPWSAHRVAPCIALRPCQWHRIRRLVEPASVRRIVELAVGPRSDEIGALRHERSALTHIRRGDREWKPGRE